MVPAADLDKSMLPTRNFDKLSKKIASWSLFIFISGEWLSASTLSVFTAFFEFLVSNKTLSNKERRSFSLLCKSDKWNQSYTYLSIAAGRCVKVDKTAD